MNNSENKAIELISKLYSNTESTKILTNTTGKILWSNLDTDTQNKIFFRKWNQDDSDNTIIGIEIEGNLFSAECSAVIVEDDKYLIFTVIDSHDILYHFGNTGEYVNVNYLLSVFKNNLNKIKTNAEDLFEKNNSRYCRQLINDQKIYCNELLRHIETTLNLSMMVFNKEKNSIYNVSVKEEITKITIACNEIIHEFGANINLKFSNDIEDDIYICTGRELLYIIISGVILTAFNSSMESQIDLIVSNDAHYAYINIPYIVDERFKDFKKSDNFEVMAAGIILECLNGKIESIEKNNKIITKIAIPLNKTQLEFHSPVDRPDKVSAKKIAELFFSDFRKQ